MPDQRNEQRFATPGHVWWARYGESVPQRGWISDTSRKGIAFVTPHAGRVQLGETILIGRGSQPDDNMNEGTDSYTVRRIEPYDEYLSLIACRKTPTR